MKKNICIAFFLIVTATAVAQEFDKNLASARTAYNSGNLEDARFNLESALREIDVVIGKEILKVLPTTLGTLNANVKEDNVTGMSSSFAGLYVHRVYGVAGAAHANIDIISDSPMMAGVNALLSMPMIMNTGDNAQKVIKIQGYKSLLTKQTDDSGATIGYEVQTPFGNSMLTLRYEGNISESEITRLANSLPLEKIIKLAQ